MSSRRALTQATRRSLNREWLLFGAAALLPAIALGALGVRALRNEEAAIRREASLAVASVAQRTVGITNEQIARASDALQHASFDDGPGRPLSADGWYGVVKGVTPISAATVVVSPSGRLAIPSEPSPVAEGHPDRACADFVQAFATSTTGARGAPKRAIVAQCPEARDDLGRWLWPTLAVDTLRDAPDTDLERRLATWLDQHAGSMRASERAATKLEIGALSGLEPAARSDMQKALEGGASRAESLAAALRSDAASKAIRNASGEAATWRGAGSVGVLRPLANGWLVGFIVTPESLESALGASSTYPITPDVRATVVRRVEGEPGKKGLPRTPIESTRDAVDRDGPASVEWITDGLGVRVALANPATLQARTSRSEALLAAIALCAGVMAIALASLIFARMRRARRTSELRTSFVAAVSHELRTPIASIRMLAELLEEGRVEEAERAEVHEALAKEAKRLGETVDRLLGFSRMAADKIVIERHPTRVAEPVTRALARFRERSPDVRVEEKIDPEIRADIDPAQIEIVIENLLANAKKYAPAGEPYVVGLERHEGDVWISVADHGPGIPRRDQRRIFEAFERLDDRLSKATEGSGIGLSLVMSAAVAHGGSAWVESEVGRGARFVVSVPALSKSDDDGNGEKP